MGCKCRGHADRYPGGIPQPTNAPDVPKLLLRRAKSDALTLASLLRSALSSYPGSPTPLPKEFLRIAKSLTLTALSLLTSPALCSPISCRVVPPDRVIGPKDESHFRPLNDQA